MSPIGNWQHFVLVWVTARRREFSVAAFTLLILANLSSTANARGGLHMEDPWASDHIEGLPPEIRQNVSKQARICGPARAQHYFSRSLSPSNSRYNFISLHFEEFGCDHRTAICRPSGCLHQVYASSGAGYRLVLSGYVGELELKAIDGQVAIETSCPHSAEACFRIQRWNGSNFGRRPDFDR
jgi:hypothetical protein